MRTVQLDGVEADGLRVPGGIGVGMGHGTELCVVQRAPDAIAGHVDARRAYGCVIRRVARVYPALGPLMPQLRGDGCAFGVNGRRHRSPAFQRVGAVDHRNAERKRGSGVRDAYAFADDQPDTARGASRVVGRYVGPWNAAG